MDIYTFYYGYFRCFKPTSPFIQSDMFVLVRYCFTVNMHDYIVPDVGAFIIYYVSVWDVCKEALCSFGEAIQIQNCINYNINEVIIYNLL